MQRIQIGSKAENLGISKVAVADGIKARLVLIDPNPQMKYVAFDNVVKRRVEVTQDILIKYNLNPVPTYYFLVARLNTDMKGNVSDDSFTVEYLQLTNNVYQEFADAIVENPNFASLVVSKVPKKGDGGKDYSYLKAMPSNYVPSQDIEAKLNVMRKNPEAIEAMWQLIDRATTITPAEYEAMLQSPMVKSDGGDMQDIPANLIDAPRKAAPAIAAPVAKPVVVQDSFDEANDFESKDDDDFNW